MSRNLQDCCDHTDLFCIWILPNAVEDTWIRCLSYDNHTFDQVSRWNVEGRVLGIYLSLSFSLSPSLSLYIYTVMAKNIGTLAILSENTTLLSENCCSCKCFGTHMFIFFCLHWNNTKKQRRKVKSDTIPHRTPKMHWTKLLAPLIFGSTPFGKNN